jgi:multimeric flavodoxin WrbA
MIKEGNHKKLVKTIEHLKDYKKVLLLTCSNRYEKIAEKEVPKSTILAKVIKSNLDNCTLINVPDLNIYPCEGNVSLMEGNRCGIKAALLKDKEKNPSGNHRCWASLHNSDDELWKISKELFESDCVLFFTSVRWGSANMFYQKLIERLNWINNRYVPLGESNLLKDISSGFICVGQHDDADRVCEVQMDCHDYYGFDVKKDLYWYWQSEDIEFDEETLKGYIESYPNFFKEFKIKKFKK